MKNVLQQTDLELPTTSVVAEAGVWATPAAAAAAAGVLVIRPPPAATAAEGVLLVRLSAERLFAAAGDPSDVIVVSGVVPSLCILVLSTFGWKVISRSRSSSTFSTLALDGVGLEVEGLGAECKKEKHLYRLFF